MAAISPLHSMRTPPEPSPPFENITPASIIAETEAIISNSISFLDRLAATLSSAPTFANFIRPLVDDANRTSCRLDTLGYLLARVSPDPAVREASRQAQTRIAAFEAAKIVRGDIATLVATIFESAETDESLDAQDRYLLARIHAEYVRSGASIRDDAKLARLQAARAEVNDLLSAAQKCFSEGKDGLWFSRAELNGLPENWLANLKVDQYGSSEERLWVTLGDNHYLPVMRSASSEETRRRLYFAAQHRFPENVERLLKIVVLRDEIARILGFENHAALKVEERMVKSIDDIKVSLDELRKKLEPLARAEMGALLQLKREDIATRRDVTHPKDTSKLYVWDRLYYARKQQNESYSVDTTKLAEYFEATHTLRGMLKIFKKLFGMEFKEAQLSTWHESVVAFTVWDNANEGGEFLGYLYLDVFRRPGKYQQAYHMPIQQSYTEGDGTRHYPVSVLSCSFPKSTVSQPSLLPHRDVKILFHELGHAIHNLLSRTKYMISHSKDYGEIPSNMLEKWIWIPEVLISLGHHYKCLKGNESTPRHSNGHQQVTANTAVPRSLAESVARIQTLNEATNTLAQIQPALFDLEIYTPADHKAAEEMDLTALWNKTRRDVLPYSCGDDTDDLGFGQAGTSHLFRTYDVGYYAYAMSKVYAADLFAKGFANDPMDSNSGKRWRYVVLQHGSSRSEAELLENFLERKPNPNALSDEIATGLRTLGIST